MVLTKIFEIKKMQHILSYIFYVHSKNYQGKFPTVVSYSVCRGVVRLKTCARGTGFKPRVWFSGLEEVRRKTSASHTCCHIWRQHKSACRKSRFNGAVRSHSYRQCTFIRTCVSYSSYYPSDFNFPMCLWRLFTSYM